MIVRIFDTAVDSDDVEQAKELFRTQVAPAFKAFDGCDGLEMLLGVGEHSGDLVEVCAISRWDSTDAIVNAIQRPEYEAALTELRKLFQQAPIVRHFETVD